MVFKIEVEITVNSISAAGQAMNEIEEALVSLKSAHPERLKSIGPIDLCPLDMDAIKAQGNI